MAPGLLATADAAVARLRPIWADMADRGAPTALGLVPDRCGAPTDAGRSRAAAPVGGGTDDRLDGSGPPLA
jgi:hypothetical protein